jgi:hypothetical protein
MRQKMKKIARLQNKGQLLKTQMACNFALARLTSAVQSAQIPFPLRPDPQKADILTIPAA